MHKHCTSSRRRLATGTSLAGLALSALAGTDQVATTVVSNQAVAPSISAWQLNKPAWLTEVSLSVKESYDDNILLVSGNGPLKPQSSFVTTVSPKIGFNFAPLLKKQTLFQVLSFGYSPDFAVYHSASGESYDAHRFTDTIKGKSGPLSYSLDNALYYIDGSTTAPTYEGLDRFRSGFASVVPKERRAQAQDRTKVLFQYDGETFFVRPTACLLYYDMMTDLSPAVGYQNYPSRYDLNGGADLGYRVIGDFAFTLGYRYGHQYQQQLPKNIDSTQFASDNDYQRILVGMEGKPWPWLTLAMQGGPDFRDYASTAAVSDRNQVTYYAEASATAVITSNDSLLLKYKQWRFVSYCGRLPYFDSDYELAYHRKLTDKLSFDLAGKIAEYDFTCASDPKGSNLRNDFLYSITPSVTYAITPTFTVTASGSIDFGRNAQDNPPGGASYREFDHNVACLSATYKF